jgi:hypothetical protein
MKEDLQKMTAFITTKLLATWSDERIWRRSCKEWRKTSRRWQPSLQPNYLPPGQLRGTEEEAVRNEGRPQEDGSLHHNQTTCRLASWEELKKKLWGMKEDLKKMAAIITAKLLAAWPDERIWRRSCKEWRKTSRRWQPSLQPNYLLPGQLRGSEEEAVRNEGRSPEDGSLHYSQTTCCLARWEDLKKKL